MRRPASTLKLAIDFSQWDTAQDVITPEEVTAWRAARVRKVVIGAGYHEAAVQQIQACADGGLGVEMYRHLFWGRPIGQQIDFALLIAMASRCRVTRLWLACEDMSIEEVTEVVAKIREARAASIIPVGIYTRRSYWLEFTGDSRQFRRLLLWDSNPDGIANMSTYQPYGGWGRCAMRQYAFDVPLGDGRKVDLNVYGV